MSFKPKIARLDAPSGPADFCDDPSLPDDLQMLARQLVDDAAFLAERFPPGDGAMDDLAVQVARSTSARRRGAWPGTAAWVSGSAAAVLLAVGLFGWIASNRDGAPADRAAASAPMSGGGATALADRQPADRSVPAAARARTIGVGATALPCEYSQPELEAVLDLLEHDTDAEVSLAF